MIAYIHKVATNLLLLVKSFKKSKLAFDNLKNKVILQVFSNCQKLLRNTIPKWKELRAKVFSIEFWRYG